MTAEELAAMERRARMFEAASEKILAEKERLREENARLRETQPPLFVMEGRVRGIVERLREQGKWRNDKAWDSCPIAEEAADEITRLREENARLRADNAWQPIETAPDGESVWLYGGFIANGDGVAENTGVEAWLERGVWFVEKAESFMRSATVVKRPTHWKRLPAPPANAAAAIREGGKDA